MNSDIPSTARLPRINVLGVGIHAISLKTAVDTISAWIDQRIRTYVVCCTVYTVMSCRDDARYHAAVHGAGLVTPDGMPMVFLSRLKGHREVTRVYGPDLVLALCEQAAERGYRQYFYGGEEGVAERLQDMLTSRFPALKCVGTYAPLFRVLTPREDSAIVAKINAAAPDVVWVALGSPVQDRWMADHRAHLEAPVLIAVGAAFNHLTGKVPQAPRWIQQCGLEWAFRLAAEPRRLWRRYLLYNPRFLWLAALQLLGLRSYSLDEQTAAPIPAAKHDTTV